MSPGKRAAGASNKLRLRVEKHHFTIERAACTHCMSSASVRPHDLWSGGASIFERQVTDGACGIVEAETITADVSTRCGLMNLEGRIKYLLAPNVKEQVVEIVVAIRPGSAVVIEDAVNC